MKIIDPVTQRHLFLLLYSIFPGQYCHEAISRMKKLRNILEVRCGYTFYGDDEKFQKDLERYDALGKVIDLTADLTGFRGFLTEKGKFLLKTNGVYNIEKKFGKELGKEIRKLD